MSQGNAQKHFFYKLCEDRKYVNYVRFYIFQGFFFSVVACLFLEGQMWVDNNAAPLCQLLVVLLSVFRVVWDFLVGCLGSFLRVLVPHPSFETRACERCFS